MNRMYVTISISISIPIPISISISNLYTEREEEILRNWLIQSHDYGNWQNLQSRLGPRAELMLQFKVKEVFW